MVPGESSPRSTTVPNGMRGSDFLELVTSMPLPHQPARWRRCAFAPMRTYSASRSMPMKLAAQALRHRAGRAGAEKRIEHHVARLGRRQDHAVQQRFGLLRRMRLVAVAVLQPLAARADRQRPVRAHLQIVIQRLHRLVIEGVAFCSRDFGRPDQRLMRIGEAPPAKIRHRIGLAPDHVVQNPEAQILQDRADAERCCDRSRSPRWRRCPSARGARRSASRRVKRSYSAKLANWSQ